MIPKVKLIGMGMLIANYQKLATLTKYQIEQDLIKSGIETENRAKGYCPIDTGRLRASTSTNWSLSGKTRAKVGGKAKANDGIGQPHGKGFQVAVGTNVIYAEPVHRRTPYLLTAYREVERLFIKKMELAMAKGINTKL